MKFSPDQFDHYPGGTSPEETTRAAHTSARLILDRGRASTDPSVTKRLVRFTDEFGLEAVAQLWAQAAPITLPGSLWRIYALRGVIRKNPALISHYYQRGMHSNYAAYVLAGVPSPPNAEEICTTVDAILAGAFTGEFDIALERFAAFCRVLSWDRTTLHWAYATDSLRCRRMPQTKPSTSSVPPKRFALRLPLVPPG